MTKIVTLIEEGYVECKIATTMGCSKTAVHSATSNLKNEGNYSDKKRKACRRKISSGNYNLMKLTVSRSTICFWITVQAKLPHTLFEGSYIGLSCSN